MLPQQILKELVHELKRIADNGEKVVKLLEETVTKLEDTAQQIAEFKAAYETKGG